MEETGRRGSEAGNKGGNGDRRKGGKAEKEEERLRMKGRRKERKKGRKEERKKWRKEERNKERKGERRRGGKQKCREEEETVKRIVESGRQGGIAEYVGITFIVFPAVFLMLFGLGIVLPTWEKLAGFRT